MTDENKLQDVDFDLFKALDALDRKDYGYYSRLTAEQQAKFQPFMLLQWMSTTKSNTGRQTRLVNFYANKHMFDEALGGREGHPELQWMMLCASGQGSKQFHQWVPEIKKSVRELKDPAKSKDVSDYFSKIYRGISSKDLKDITGAFLDEHEHKRRIKAIYPDMKLADIEALAKIITVEELDERDRQSGN
jgi:hypothetical protein